MSGGSRSSPTGVPGLDEALGGGLPLFSTVVVAGPPGTGKSTLAQQALFHHAGGAPGARGVYFTTFSESPAKAVRHARGFDFFDAEAFGEGVVYYDLGGPLRRVGPADGLDLILELVRELRPSLIAIDSFSALGELWGGGAEFRLFCYDLAERLNAVRCTTILVSEEAQGAGPGGPEFNVADGVIRLRLSRAGGLAARSLRVEKLRGRAADLRRHTFRITDGGVAVGDDGAAGAPAEPCARVPAAGYPRAWAAADALPAGGHGSAAGAS